MKEQKTKPQKAHEENEYFDLDVFLKEHARDVDAIIYPDGSRGDLTFFCMVLK